MSLKLSDVLGGTFHAAPLEDIPQDMEMSHERPPVVIPERVVEAGKVLAPWEADRLAKLAEVTPEPEPIAVQLTQAPQVQPQAPGLQLPWLAAAQQEALAQAAAEPEPQAPATELAKDTGELGNVLEIISQIPAPSILDKELQESIESAQALASDSTEGWNAGSPSEEATECVFRSTEDSNDWIIAKGRSFGYLAEERPDPFDVKVMYEMLDNKVESVFMHKPITSFRMACRHAIANTLFYYEQDVNNHHDMVEARKCNSAVEEKEAAISKAHRNWKALVDERKVILAELDRKVTEARDIWHELRK